MPYLKKSLHISKICIFAIFLNPSEVKQTSLGSTIQSLETSQEKALFHLSDNWASDKGFSWTHNLGRDLTLLQDNQNHVKF